MKRSRINEILREGDAFIRSFGYVMPPFAYWSPEELRARKPRASSRRGSAGTSPTTGKTSSTNSACSCSQSRNGRAEDLARGQGMLYAEKIMISRKNQLSPMHRHVVKAEDIINRGGGKLVLELFMPDAEGNIDHAGRGARCRADGVMRKLPRRRASEARAGRKRDASAGRVAWILGRGRRCADRRSFDGQRRSDRQYLPRPDRHASPQIEEDEAPLHLLVSDYDSWLSS